ncbi:MAG: ABC transporter permease [Cyclobacteriaceae bacterium]
MFRNYLKVALRNIVKHRTFSFINIFGLAVAMCVCMAIMMMVADQMMVDRDNPLADRIYRINTIPYWKDNNGQPGNETASTTLPLRDELLTNYTGIEKAVRFMRGFGNTWLELEPSFDVNIPVSGYFTDAETLEMFDYQLLYGDMRTALVEPYSVVLTKQAAEKLFEKENPVGETLKVGNLGVYTVTGVIKNTDKRSHIVVEAFASISTVPSLEKAGVMTSNIENWDNAYSGWVYVQLAEGTTPEDVQVTLGKVTDDHFVKRKSQDGDIFRYSLQNLLDIVPGPLLNNPIGPFMPWYLIYFLSFIAGVILITSCFNFTNLSIARSLTRAKEIGVRKVTGAVRWQLFVQFLSESVVIALFALVLALALIYVIKPLIADLAFVRLMRWNLSANYVVYGLFLLFAVAVGIIAGLFPAGVLSGFQPIKVLKNIGNSKLMSKVGLRKVLLVVQFSVSMIFILTVIVLYNQLNLFLHNDNGFVVENKVIIHKGNTSLEVLKPELEKQPSVISVSASSHIPMAGMVRGTDMQKPGTDTWSNLSYFSVDEDYLDNMGLTLIAGKFFEKGAGASNSNFIVLNEEAVKSYQLGTPSEAIGQHLVLKSDSSEKLVIGVVKNYYHELFTDKLNPLGFLYLPEEYSLLQVSYAGDLNAAKKSVEKAWATVNPGLKADVKEFKAEMGVLYEIIFGTMVKVLGFISMLAIIISCLGLLGMATYTIQTRKKEIAVRKILGSSNRSLVLTLSRGYFALLLIAIGLAVPIGYFINTLWLENFVLHVTVDVLTIGAGVFILGVLGLITIGSQTLQAVYLNPVENLKEE